MLKHDDLPAKLCNSAIDCKRPRCLFNQSRNKIGEKEKCPQITLPDMAMASIMRKNPTIAETSEKSTETNEIAPNTGRRQNTLSEIIVFLLQSENQNSTCKYFVNWKKCSIFVVIRYLLRKKAIMAKKVIRITEAKLNQIVKETINEFQSANINERDDRDVLVEMARINKNETGKCIFPYNKWEVKIWSFDHNPPHFHIRCDRWNVSFVIENGNVLEVLEKGDDKQVYEYMVANADKWLSSKCFAQPKLTNRENAQLIWEQLHDED